MKLKYVLLLIFFQASSFADFAPESGVGIAALVNIESGTEFLAPTGQAVLTTDLSGNRFALIGDENVDDGYGVYVWNKTSANRVSFTLFDEVSGITATYFLTYTSLDGGTFSVSIPSVGAQTGTFEMHYILKPSAVSSALAMGQPVAKVEQGQIEIEIQIKSSEDLSSFSPQSGTVRTDGNGKITFTTPANAGSKFYRIEVLNGNQ